MYIAMNRFKVQKGKEEEFENIWKNRNSTLDEMKGFLPAIGDGLPDVVVGDLNVAPHEHDVWSHKQLLNVVSHTPVEVDLMNEIYASHDWVDVMRRFVPAEEKLYSWWSYRAKDWAASDRGRRLDHIWVTPALGDRVSDFRITRDARGWERPSDHVPVTAVIEV